MAYNEVGTLKASVLEISQALQAIKCRYEIVIIDDGSSDGTAKVGDVLAFEVPYLRVIHHETNKGLGGVYRTGFEAAENDYITFFPADGQFSPEIIGRFFRLMDGSDNAVDMVLGYIPSRGDLRMARLLSWCERVLYSVLFGSFPKFQGILMFRRELLNRVTLKAAGRSWVVLMEFILRVYQSNCYHIINEPINLRLRQADKSKVMNLRTIAHSLTQIIQLRFQY
jgi:glycosyltransferase involved in cell wall biosynthesis